MLAHSHFKKPINLCIFSLLFVFLQLYSQAQVSITNVQNSSGFGCNNGSITLNVNSSCGGVNVVSSFWGTGWLPNGTYTNVVAPGSYTGTYSGSCCVQQCWDAANSTWYCCQDHIDNGSLSVTITEPPCQISLNTVSVNQISHFFCNDAQINAVGHVATGTCMNYLSYTLSKDGNYYSSASDYSGNAVQWSNLAPGNYVLEVSNGACTASQSYTIAEPPCDINLVVTNSDLTSSGVNCTDGVITFESQSQSCIATHMVNVSKNGQPYSSWSYTFANNPQTLSNLGAGIYEIVVDNGYCSYTLPTQEVEDPACSIALNNVMINQSSGFSCNNGSITYTPITNTCNPSTFISSLYKNGQLYDLHANVWWWYWWWNTADAYNNLGPGNYSMHVFDGECDKALNFIITEPTCNLAVTIDTFTHLSGFNCNDGTLTFSLTDSFTCATSGAVRLFRDSIVFNDYFYSSTNPPLNSGYYTYNNLPVGTYYLTIWNGYCHDTTASVVLNQPTCGSSVSIDSYNQLTGFACNDGNLTFTTASGSDCNNDYIYYIQKDGQAYSSGGWYNFTSTPTHTIANLPSGEYAVVIWNGYCYDTSTSVLISAPTCGSNVSIDSYNQLTGFACNDGNLTFTTASGSACNNDYIYYIQKDGQAYSSGGWYNFNTTPSHTISNLSIGEYAVIIWNGYCYDTSASVMITQPDCGTTTTISNSINPSGISCNDGSFTFTTSSSSACNFDYYFYVYKNAQNYTNGGWYNFVNTPTHTISNLSAGDYYVIVWNGSCYDTSNVIAIEEPASDFTLTLDAITPSNGYSCNSGSISFTPNRINTCLPNYRYDVYKNGTYYTTNYWIPYAQQSVISGLGPGNYELKILNYNFEDTSILFSITEPDKAAFTCTIDAITNSSGYSCSNGSIVFTPAMSNPCLPNYRYDVYKNGTYYYTNYWIPYGQQSIVGGLGPGNYELKILNYNYEDTSILFNITEPDKAAFTCTIDAITNSSGYSCTNGSIVFTPAMSNPCLPNYRYDVYKNGTYYYTNYWIPYGQQSVVGGLSQGNYEIKLFNYNYQDTTFSFSITEPPCTMDLQINSTSFNTSSGCNSGSIDYIINTSSCLNNVVKLFKNGLLLMQNNALASNSASAFNGLTAGTYFIVASNGSCHDTSATVVINNALTISSSIANPICTISLPLFTVTPANAIVSPTYRWKVNGITMQTSSSTTYAPTAIADGDVITCQLIGTGCNITSNALTLQVILCSDANVTVKAFIEGFYLGNGEMTPVLMNSGLSTSLTDVDTVSIQLHEATSPYNIVYTHAGLLQTDGTIAFTLPSSYVGNSYYISLHHRNSIETWSANPVPINIITNYDFSSAATQAYGDNLVIHNGAFTIYSGDINQDQSIDAFDYLLMDPDIIAGNSGYLVSDMDGNGVIDGFDYILLEPNLVNGISAALP